MCAMTVAIVARGGRSCPVLMADTQQGSTDGMVLHMQNM